MKRVSAFYAITHPEQDYVPAPSAFGEWLDRQEPLLQAIVVGGFLLVLIVLSVLCLFA